MPDKFTTVRLSISGEQFEILVRPEPALSYKLGRDVSLSEVIAFEEVYSDSSKGLRVSSEKLEKHFGTTDFTKVAETLIRNGELQLTTEQRRKMIEDKRKQIVQLIARSYVDPRTRTPHPPLRIEQAMQDARVQIDPFKDGEEQAKGVIENLRAIIPLKSEQVRFRIVIPAQFAPQSFGVLKSFGELKDEAWGADGSFTTTLEVPAGIRASLIDRLASVTKGSAQAIEV